jgi:hypothetical protein
LKPNQLKSANVQDHDVDIANSNSQDVDIIETHNGSKYNQIGQVEMNALLGKSHFLVSPLK